MPAEIRNLLGRCSSTSSSTQRAQGSVVSIHQGGVVFTKVTARLITKERTPAQEAGDLNVL